MLLTLIVCFLVISTDCMQEIPQIKDSDRVLVKLDPAQVVDAFKSVMSSDYLRALAHDLASRAAEQFITEMKNKQPVTEKMPSGQSRFVARQKAIKLAPPRNTDTMKQEVIQEIESMPKEHLLSSDFNTSIIDVKQAMTLLTDPAPDGDNLDLVSPNLSDEEDTKEKKKDTPVIQLLKVNGKYFRRLLGFV